MKKNPVYFTLSWQIILGLILIAISAALYWIHYLIFHDAHHIWIFLMEDIAFIPIEVLLVTLIIHQVLSIREKNALIKKMNMVIGTFFNEMGTELFKRISYYDPKAETLVELLLPAPQWRLSDFDKTKKRLADYEYTISMQLGNIEELKSFLLDKRDFLLGLLENPNLLEHESFTDLLWAVFHLMDELAHRKHLTQLPEADYNHLTGDIKRIYSLIIYEWLMYMKHLKTDYPYLFSMAVRTNPFNKNASVIIE